MWTIDESIYYHNLEKKMQLKLPIFAYEKGQNSFVFVNQGHSFRTYANFFRKNKIFYPLIHKHTCAYLGVRTVSFSENFAYLTNEEYLMLLVSWRNSCHNKNTGYKKQRYVAMNSTYTCEKIYEICLELIS